MYCHNVKSITFHTRLQANMLPAKRTTSLRATFCPFVPLKPHSGTPSKDAKSPKRTKGGWIVFYFTGQFASCHNPPLQIYISLHKIFDISFGSLPEKVKILICPLAKSLKMYYSSRYIKGTACGSDSFLIFRHRYVERPLSFFPPFSRSPALTQYSSYILYWHDVFHNACPHFHTPCALIV